MIDREARDELAENIQHLVTGQITNRQFEERLQTSSDDAVYEVFFNGIWGLYSDLHEHTLKGEHAVSREIKPNIARAILFLKSNLEYEWPRNTGIKELPWALFSILTLGIAGRKRAKRRMVDSGGEEAVWPFFRTADYEEALGKHPYSR